MENPIKWIDEWVQLYPADIEFNGVKLRSSTKDCINKMQKFCKQHPEFTKDIIFAATKAYLQERAAKGYEYTKQATYLINKLGQPSVLENYCEKILSGTHTNVEVVIPEYNSINDFI